MPRILQYALQTLQISLIAITIWASASTPSHAAVTSSVSGSILTVDSDGDGDNIEITVVGGMVKINGSDPDTGPVSAVGITSITVNGNGGADIITLSGVTGSDFTNLISVLIFGGDGNDQIHGSVVADYIEGNGDADTITPGPGADTILMGEGDDLLIWNDGDGSDFITGGGDNDVVEVNASDTDGDQVNVTFLIGMINVDRTNLAPFKLEIGSTEKLVVNGRSGEDILSGAPGLDGEISLTLEGGPDADQLFGGDGDDILRGGDDGDVLDGGTGSDSLFGEAGNDLIVWNDGDGDDYIEGGGDFDVAEINGSPSLGDNFLIQPNGPRVLFRRTNLVLVNLDIGTTEELDINSLGGEDNIIGDVGLAGLTTLDMDGGTEDDLIVGGDGDDTIRDSSGCNTLFGDGGNDTFIINIAAGCDVEGGSGTADEVLLTYTFMTADVVVPTENNGKLILSAYEIGTVESMVIGLGQGNDIANLMCEVAALSMQIEIQAGADFDTAQISGTSGNDNIEIMRSDDDALVTCSSSGTGTFRLNGFEELFGVGDAGDDFVQTQGLPLTEQHLDGGTSTTAAASKTMAGDELVLDAEGKDVVDLGGQFIITGALPVNYTGFENVNVINPLPVELVAFDAVADAGDVILQWNTASETNNAGFEIEMAKRSDATASDQPVWENIGFVEGRGTTNEPFSYAFRVPDVEIGTHRFRLKQVDFDGAFEYSPAVEVVIEIAGPYALSRPYPNPAGRNMPANFTLAVSQRQHVRVALYDVIGREVDVIFDGEMVEQREHRFRISTEDLAPGQYFYTASADHFDASEPLIVH